MDPHFDGVIFQTHAAELRRRVRTSFPPYRILDVRPEGAFAEGRIPGATSTSAEALEREAPEGLASGTELFVIGASAGDPAIRQASLALLAHGAKRVVELPGGMAEWLEAGGGLETGVAGTGAQHAA